MRRPPLSVWLPHRENSPAALSPGKTGSSYCKVTSAYSFPKAESGEAAGREETVRGCAIQADSLSGATVAGIRNLVKTQTS